MRVPRIWFCLIAACAIVAAQGGRGGSPEIRGGPQPALEGKTAEAKSLFQKAIDSAATPAAKANAQRAMAMSYAFDGDCKNWGTYEQMVIDYWNTQEKDQPGSAFYQEGEMANEVARVCTDAGDLYPSKAWFTKGH